MSHFIRLIFTLLVSTWGTLASSDEFIILQSTTSTQNSGLFDAILPKFEAATGIDVRVVAVGTGQALRNARNGDGDVLLVHAKEAEETFVAQGYGIARHDVMFNDFVLVGPSVDPAEITTAQSVTQALARIAQRQARFASRGDDSGTHKAEMRLWAAASETPEAASGTWYIETGSGMGATLNIAAGLGAYALTDRATWISFGNKGDLQLLYEGDAALFNQYGVIAVNPAIHGHVKFAAANQFIQWITGQEGQTVIAEFSLDGQQLFFPNAAE